METSENMQTELPQCEENQNIEEPVYDGENEPSTFANIESPKEESEEISEQDYTSQRRDERGNAIYVRTRYKATNAEVTKHLDILREFALKNGIMIKYEYFDKSSAFVLNEMSRRGLYGLLEKVIARKVSTIYAYSADNISPVASTMINHICRMFGTRIVYVADASQIAANKAQIYKELAEFSAHMLSRYGEYCKK